MRKGCTNRRRGEGEDGLCSTASKGEEDAAREYRASPESSLGTRNAVGGNDGRLREGVSAWVSTGIEEITGPRLVYKFE